MDQHDIWFNGKLVPFESATVHVLTHALHYGSSVFEGIRCYATDRGPAVLRLREHTRRLVDSAKIYRMEIPYDLDTIDGAVLDTIAASGMGACYIRPLVYRGFGKMGVNPLHNPVETAIAVWDWGGLPRPRGPRKGRRRARLVVAALRAEHDPGARQGGRQLPLVVARQDGRRARRLRRGHHAQHRRLRGGRLGREPVPRARRQDRDAACGALGAPRHHARPPSCTLARDAGYEVEEALIPREALYLADELFFTGTAAEITPVRTVDHHTIGTGRRGPVTEALQNAFNDIIHRGNDPYGWLTFVGDRTTATGDGAAVEAAGV